MKHLTNDILKCRNNLDELNFEKNNTYPFIPCDSEELFNKNLERENRNYSLLYYLKNPIKYSLNNEGFRTPDDFNSEDEGNVYLGCSHTFGIGHHLENTWSYKLNQQIGGKFWNLSVGGTGVATHFRLLFGYYKELKIKNIFHYAPKYPRYEFIINKTPRNFIISNYNKNWLNQFGDLMETCLLTDEQCEYNWITYTSAIRGIASEIGCNYYLIDRSDKWDGRNDKSLLARDIIHHTTLLQHMVFKDFLKMYNPKMLDNIENDLSVFDIEKFFSSDKKTLL